MDHDFLMSNDFAGEALLKLDEIPGCATATERSGSWKSFTLPLAHPDHKNIPMIKVLESRKDDKDAQEFVRHVENIRRT
uniref:Uncharacterized protein n=1 Tax=Romanomermis culicivorax TaxID=13658 RepID=A0A915JSN4_ROMCU